MIFSLRQMIGLILIFAFAVPSIASVNEDNMRRGWQVISLSSSDCTILYTNDRNDQMFQYQMHPDGQFVFGTRSPDLPASIGADADDSPIMILFGGNGISAEGEIDPLYGRKMSRGDYLDLASFKLFQDFESVEVAMGKHTASFPLAGVEGIKSDYATCIGHLARAISTPKILSWPRSKEFEQALTTILELAETVSIEINVDATGHPTSCETTQNQSVRTFLSVLCQHMLEQATFSPATDAEDESVDGSFVLVSKIYDEPTG